MAAPNSVDSKKAANAGAKKAPSAESTHKTLGGAGKASVGGVSAFDLEAFVKVKFWVEDETTARQKKV